MNTLRIRSRTASCMAILGACAVSLGYGLDAQAAGPFDGAWNVTLNCPTAPDNTLSYTWQFPATVVQGVLHGEHGVKDGGSWLTLDGKIEPDGSSTLMANGLTNAPAYAVGHPQPRTPYTYEVSAHFDAASGSGQRTTTRHCDFVFVKQ